MNRTTRPNTAPELIEKQRRILEYLREHAADLTYFKSRPIAEDLSLSAKGVGANMGAIRRATSASGSRSRGYSSGTTWEVPRARADCHRSG
jgi:hypothetical protein